MIVAISNASIDESIYANQITQSQESLQNIQDNFGNSNTQSQSTVLYQQFGDARLGQEIGIFNVLKAGWGWIDYEQYPSGSLDRELIIIVDWFFGIINGLLILEIIFLIYSRKHT